MTITLSITSPGGSPSRYRYLWLKYVIGFVETEHCARCLRGTYEKRVSPRMVADGTPLVLAPGDAPWLYLCGVSPRWATNLHLAMRPLVGAVATVDGFDGTRVRVDGAEAVTIPSLPAGFRGLPKAYTTCRNFQFGVAHLESEAIAR